MSGHVNDTVEFMMLLVDKLSSVGLHGSRPGVAGTEVARRATTQRLPPLI